MTTDGLQPGGDRSAGTWWVGAAVLWVVAVAGFVAVPLIFHDEMQARERAHRSEAEVAQVFGAAIDEGLAPAAVRGNFAVAGMFSGQICRVDYTLANGEWAGFLARRNAAGQWRFEDVFLTDGVRRGFVHGGARN
ncbi:hypothetical protein DB345_02270 [Spartobacteria bacterium LR76]|nr:hypothetical protein DB345_02270 [Spartobacteria bacterium LR76]